MNEALFKCQCIGNMWRLMFHTLYYMCCTNLHTIFISEKVKTHTHWYMIEFFFSFTDNTITSYKLAHKFHQCETCHLGISEETRLWIFIHDQICEYEFRITLQYNALTSIALSLLFMYCWSYPIPTHVSPTITMCNVDYIIHSSLIIFFYIKNQIC